MLIFDVTLAVLVASCNRVEKYTTFRETAQHRAFTKA